MLERYPWLLPTLCAVLGLVAASQFVGVIQRLSPLGTITVPKLPSWTPPVQPASSGPPGSPQASAPNPSPPSGPNLNRSRWSESIVQSGLLGPIIRPPPMALLGIAGNEVLLRSSDGQVGLLEVGGRLGPVELVRIGTNRVLVRENNAEKELLIFEGYGGESLLNSKSKGHP